MTLDSKDHAQRSDEWFNARLGKFTASNAWKLVDRTAKGLTTAAYKDYFWKTVIERITGHKTEIYTTPAMQWGVDTEPMACAFYQELYEVEVDETGLHHHPKYDFIAASPDGIVFGTKKVLEIKCPNTKTFLEVKLTNEPPKEYFYQVQHQMMCLEYEEADLFFFDPRLPAQMSFHRFNIKRDDEVIKQLEQAAIALNDEVEATILKLTTEGK